MAFKFVLMTHFVIVMTNAIVYCDFLIFMPDKPSHMGLFFYTLADSKER